MKEAQYNCCWNANYCNEMCQQSHWPEHMDSCTQVQQQAPPRTPNSQVAADHDTPLQKAPEGQLSPTLGMRSTPNGVGGGAGISGQQDPQQQGFMFPAAAAAAAQVQSQAQAQAQSQAFAAQAQAQAQAQAIQAQAQMLSQAHGGGVGGSGQQQPPGRMSPMGNATQVSK